MEPGGGTLTSTPPPGDKLTNGYPFVVMDEYNLNHYLENSVVKVLDNNDLLEHISGGAGTWDTVKENSKKVVDKIKKIAKKVAKPVGVYESAKEAAKGFSACRKDPEC